MHRVVRPLKLEFCSFFSEVVFLFLLGVCSSFIDCRFSFLEFSSFSRVMLFFSRGLFRISKKFSSKKSRSLIEIRISRIYTCFTVKIINHLNKLNKYLLQCDLHYCNFRMFVLQKLIRTEKRMVLILDGSSEHNENMFSKMIIQSV